MRRKTYVVFLPIWLFAPYCGFSNCNNTPKSSDSFCVLTQGQYARIAAPQLRLISFMAYLENSLEPAHFMLIRHDIVRKTLQKPYGGYKFLPWPKCHEMVFDSLMMLSETQNPWMCNEGPGSSKMVSKPLSQDFGSWAPSSVSTILPDFLPLNSSTIFNPASAINTQ